MGTLQNWPGFMRAAADDGAASSPAFRSCSAMCLAVAALGWLACAPAVAAPIPPMPSCAFEGRFTGGELVWRAPVGQMVSGVDDTRLVFRVDKVETLAETATPYGSCPTVAAETAMSFRDFRGLDDAIAALAKQGVVPGVRVRGVFTRKGDEHWMADVLLSIAPITGN